MILALIKGKEILCAFASLNRFLVRHFLPPFELFLPDVIDIKMFAMLSASWMMRFMLGPVIIGIPPERNCHYVEKVFLSVKVDFSDT